MRRAATVCLAAVLPFGLALAEAPPFAFVPDGGRQLFAQVYPGGEGEQALAQQRTVADWLQEIATRAPDLPAREAETLAAYLAAVAPLDLPGEDPMAALPPDGRDLALAQCQSCHGLFSGYLTQRRDRAGWLAIFASPFHSGIAMTEAERAVFADYSALNMPLRVEDVPPELRF